MAADAWTIYNEFKANLGEKLIDLSSDTIKCALFLSTSNCGDATLVDAHYATLTNQHGNQASPGYETGGKTVAATWVEAAGTVTFDVADAAWTATGGNIVCRYAVLYSDTAADKDLIAYCLLDNSPADVTCTTGNTLTVTINASGVFTLAQA